ncbi:hypothetical protein ACHAWF_009924, partial [Thalassiosira exigua]
LEQAFHQALGVLREVRTQLVQPHPTPRADVLRDLAGQRSAPAPDFARRGVARQLEDPLRLSHRRRAGEEGTAAEHLPEDAPHAPEVDPLRVPSRSHQDLGAAVPPRRDVVGQVVRTISRGDRAAQPEVAKLRGAVGVDQDVRRLHVAVQQPRAVDVLEAPQELIRHVSNVHWFQDPGLDHPREVRLDVLERDVQVPVVVRAVDAQDLHDVLVSRQRPEVHDLPKRALGVDVAAERLEALFEGDREALASVHGLPDDAVRALADLLAHVEAAQDPGIDRVGHLSNIVRSKGETADKNAATHHAPHSAPPCASVALPLDRIPCLFVWSWRLAIETGVS